MSSHTAFGPIISAQALHERLQATPGEGQQPRLVVVDCSFDLMNPSAGHEQYLQNHIPGALYAHLDQDLSQKDPAKGPTASGGRHPLPTREQFASTLGQWGIDDPNTQVVAYDRNGNMVGGRLWWMLQWCGHAQVAVLDGGWAAWTAAGFPTEAGPVAHGDVSAPGLKTGAATPYPLSPALVQLVSASDVLQQLGSAQQTLIDARANPRFKGDVEPLDPAAGHIPGALNRPFSDNFNAQSLYHAPEALRATFDNLLGTRPASSVVLHCGSGVSAIPNLIAMKLAGYPTPALFAGSWSEWCSDPSRPVAKG